MNCALCDEPLLDGTASTFPTVWTEEGPRGMHRECSLREVLGGIGHLVAHEYWCTQKHDPDAGLTYRQSALMVDFWVQLMGVEDAAAR